MIEFQTKVNHMVNEFNPILILHIYLQKYTAKNSFSSNNLVNIFRFTSSISFLISNTSCEVNQVRIFSASNKSPGGKTNFKHYLVRVTNLFARVGH